MAKASFAVTLVLGLLLLPKAAQAVLIWDPVAGNLNVIDDGVGDWGDDPIGLTWPYWNMGMYPWNVGWDNANPDVAQFGVAPSTSEFTVYVDTFGGATAQGIIFNRQYRLTGGPITLAGDAPVISIPAASGMNIQPTIESPLMASGSTLEINGYATSANYSLLTLTGANSYTGTLKLTGGGFVYVANTSGIPTDSAGVIVEPNCTLAPSVAGTYNVPDVHISGYGAGQTAESISMHRGAIRFAQPANESLVWNGNIILDAEAVIATYSTGSVTTMNGVISGGYRMIKTGVSELILTNQNTYTGGTRIYRGTLSLACETGYAILGDVDFRKCYSGSGKTLAVLHGDDDGMPQMEPTAVVYFDGDIGSQYLDLRGHTLTLAGISNLTTTSNGRSAIQNHAENTAGTLVVNNSSDHTYRGIIRDNGGTLALVKRGTGTLTLDGWAHQFTGGLTVEQGTLVYGPNTSVTSHYSPALVVKSGATLDVSAVAGFALSDANTPSIDVLDPSIKAPQILSGGGTVVGSVLVSTGGHVAPGESVGTLTFDGSLDFATNGDLTWELGALVDTAGGGVPGVDFDSLVVLGNLALGGTSQLTLDFSAVGNPNAGVAFWNSNHAWKIVDVGGTATGNFSAINNGTFDVGAFSTTIDAQGDVLLKYTVGGVQVPGDADRSGTVDHLDAAILARHWLETQNVGWDEGDFNRDGRVDDLDASILAANWVYAGSAAAVPEPATLTLGLALAVGGIVLARRRRGK